MSGIESSLAPAPEPADVGIVAALPMEVAPLKLRLKEPRSFHVGDRQVIEGELGGKLVTMMVTGPGRSASRRAVSLLIAGHRPRWILSIGFAGALVATVDRHSIFLPSHVIDPEGREWLTQLDPTGGGPYRTGLLATVDHIVRTSAEKAELAAKTAAEAVDMESSAVAEVCVERGLRFLGVRVITDTAQEDLPPEILTILGPTGGYRIGAAAGAIWRRPSSLKDLWKLREHAIEASRRLGQAVPGLISQLG